MSFSHVQALDVFSRHGIEISRDQLGVSQSIDSETQAMTIHAHTANHFFVGPQIRVLVMIHHHSVEPLLLVDFPWHVTGGARDAAIRRSIPFQFRMPELEMGRLLIGQTVLVVVAGQT